MINLRCERCGRLLRVESGSASTRCPHCRARVTIPDAVACLAQPHVPGHLSATPHDLPPPHGADSPSDALPARVMPWILSLLLHVGVGLITMFVFVISDPQIPPPTVAGLVPIHNRPDKSPLVSPTDPVENNQLNREDTRDENAFGSHGDESLPNPADQSGEDRPRKIVDIVSQSGLVPLKDGTGRGLFGVNIDKVPRGGPDKTPPCGGGARNYIYLIDCSGSMAETFDALRVEMVRTIARLGYSRTGRKVPRSRRRHFHVILFSRGKPLEFTPGRLVPADVTHRAQVVDFLMSVRPEGRTDPIPALQRAFDVADSARGGTIIYFLTDGAFPDSDAVVKLIRRRNARKRAAVYTFLYGTQAPQAAAVMQAIANENLGRFTSVDLDQ